MHANPRCSGRCEARRWAHPLGRIKYKENDLNLSLQENLLLKTNVSIEEQRIRLNNVIGQPKLIIIIPDRRFKYSGIFRDDEFKVRRNTMNIKYKNSFKPEIIGKLMDTGYQRSFIYLSIRPNIFLVAFMLFCFGMALLTLIGSLTSVVSNLSLQSLDLRIYTTIFVIAMVLLVFLILTYRMESNISKKFFINLFDPYQVDVMKDSKGTISP